MSRPDPREVIRNLAMERDRLLSLYYGRRFGGGRAGALIQHQAIELIAETRDMTVPSFDEVCVAVRTGKTL